MSSEIPIFVSTFKKWLTLGPKSERSLGQCTNCSYVCRCLAINLKSSEHIFCTSRGDMKERFHGDTTDLTFTPRHTRTGRVQDRWTVDFRIFAQFKNR